MAMQAYRERRERALTAFAGGTAIVPSARETLRSGDSTYPFRQDSDFFYLTGFEEPDAVLVLAPEHPDHRTVVFLRDRDRTQEIWNGARMGVERAADALGVDAAFPIGELAQRLPEYLLGSETLHYAFGARESDDRMVREALETARSRTRRQGIAPQRFAEPSLVLHAMRLVKDDAEIATMRRAAEVTARGHIAGMRATHPGAYEYEIAATIENAYRFAGGQPAYESIVGAGDNATVLHYVTNRAQLRAGQLLLVDSACELDNYATDVTRTWPVDGRFSAEQRAIYDIVLRAQQAAIDCVKPGFRREASHAAAVRTIVEGLIDVGLLSGSADENIERETYRDYYMHGTGHWLGLDVHDAGPYRDADDESIVLRAGMVTTVEPGIYVHRDLNCDDRFKGIGVRIEDDILVTPDGNDNLSASTPKAIDEIAALIGTATEVVPA